jgi:hypothetical protein
MEVSLLSCSETQLKAREDESIILLAREFLASIACPLSDMDGRPLPLLDDRAPIAELV